MIEANGAAKAIPVALAILLISVVGVALSLFIPLLALEMERRGIPAWQNGLNTAVAGIGTLAFSPFVPKLARSIGTARIILAAILVAATSGVAFLNAPFWSWFPLRFVFGAAIGTLFVLSEFWISSAATPAKRGLIMGIYATVLSAGFASGPLILAAANMQPNAAAIAGSFVLAFAAVPLLLAWKKVPQLQDEPRSDVIGIMRQAPIGPLAGLLFGALESGAIALLPVYGLRNGLPEANATVLISIMMAGNILLQIPLGLLSDKMDRVRLLMVLAALGGFGAMLLPLTMDLPMLRTVLLFTWGGITGGLYTVGLALLASRFSGSALAEANAAFVMLYSGGMILGPPMLGISMDAVGSHGFAWLLAVALAVFAGFAWKQRAQPHRA